MSVLTSKKKLTKLSVIMLLILVKVSLSIFLIFSVVDSTFTRCLLLLIETGILIAFFIKAAKASDNDLVWHTYGNIRSYPSSNNQTQYNNTLLNDNIHFDQILHHSAENTYSHIDHNSSSLFDNHSQYESMFSNDITFDPTFNNSPGNIYYTDR